MKWLDVIKEIKEGTKEGIQDACAYLGFFYGCLISYASLQFAPYETMFLATLAAFMIVIFELPKEFFYDEEGAAE